jgi:hypothetical protein
LAKEKTPAPVPDSNAEGGEPKEGSQPDVEELVNRTVNAALRSHMTRVKQALSKDLGSLVSDALKPISEQLAAIKPPAPQDGEPKDLERQKFNDRIQELEKRAKDAELAREAEIRTRTVSEDRSALADALRKGGVADGASLKAAVALLYTEEQRVVRDDRGRIVVKQEGKYGEELVPLEEGIGAWLASNEGKSFLPARGASGSGNVHNQGNNGSGKYVGNPKDAKAAAKQEAYNVLIRHIAGEDR